MARAGDKAAFERFCAIARDGLILIVSRRFPDFSEAEVEDIVHDTFEVFLSKYHEIDTSSAGYLRTVLYNVIGTKLRARRVDRIRAASLDASNRDHGHMDVERRLENSNVVELCIRTASSLDEPDRTLMLSTFKGQSVNQIWEWFKSYDKSASFESYKRRLYRTRQKFWSLMKEGER
ncbi:MAG: sigma-70 family RNA polymerase sigma factor [Calditrichaeota bacterium]|nr:sigma-70 family RNA polymerase sigma factor [Calditrichota bacterium]